MTPPNPGGLDAQGEARQALAAAVKDYGPGVLANPSLLGNLFKDLLPGAPREASLLVAASEAGASSMLEQQVAGVGPDAAVRTVASDLSRNRALDPQASLWAVSEVARAMGYPISEPTAAAPPPPGATLPWVTPGAAMMTPPPIAPVPPATPPLPWAGAVIPPPGPPASTPVAGPPPSPYQPYGSAPPGQPPSPWGGPPPATPPPFGMGYPPQQPGFAPRRNRTPMALAALVAVVLVIAAYFGIAAAAKLPPFSAKPVATVTCPSGEHVSGGVCVPASTPSVPASPSSSLPISGAATGGYGDTSNNPDQSFTCAFDVLADDNVTVVAYLTVAGSSSSDTGDLCSGFEAQQYYDEVQSLDVSGAAYCWLTTQDGGATLRFYTAPDGAATDTHEICAAVFAAAGVST
jgi:hypothetical protein